MRVLVDISSTGKKIYKDIDTGGGTWGSITGTLSAQTDLQNALNEKVTEAQADARYLKLTGGTLSDTLKISKGSNIGNSDLQLLENASTLDFGGILRYDGADNKVQLLTIESNVEKDFIFDAERAPEGLVLSDRPWLFGKPYDVSNHDANTLTRTGVYKGNNITNAPDSSWWYINNYIHDESATYVTQIAIELSSSDGKARQYIRKNQSGTWGEWYKDQAFKDPRTGACEGYEVQRSVMNKSSTGLGWAKMGTLTMLSGTNKFLMDVTFRVNLPGLIDRGPVKYTISGQTNGTYVRVDMLENGSNVSPGSIKVTRETSGSNAIWSFYIYSTGYTLYTGIFEFWDLPADAVFNNTTVQVATPAGTEYAPYQMGDTGWISPTLTSGWVNYGSAPSYQQAGYKRVGNQVYLRGLIKNGTSGSMFTLPVGFRPKGDHIFCAFCNNTDYRVNIADNGIVVASTNYSASWSSLSGIVFSID